SAAHVLGDFHLTETVDVFFSYNSKDEDSVRQVAEKLRRLGLHVWMDKDDLRLGRTWGLEVEEVLRKIHSAAIFIGPFGLGDWQNYEARLCLTQSVKRGIPLIPVLLPGGPSPEDVPLFLAERTCADLRKGISDDRLRRLAREIRAATASEAAHPSGDGRGAALPEPHSEATLLSANKTLVSIEPSKATNYLQEVLAKPIPSPEKEVIARSEVVGLNRSWMVFSYMWFLTLITLTVKRKSPEAQWHARNGLLLTSAEFTLYVGASIIAHFIPFSGCFLILLQPLILLISVALRGRLIIGALKGEHIIIPGITKYADSATTVSIATVFLVLATITIYAETFIAVKQNLG